MFKVRLQLLRNLLELAAEFAGGGEFSLKFPHLLKILFLFWSKSVPSCYAKLKSVRPWRWYHLTKAF